MSESQLRKYQALGFLRKLFGKAANRNAQIMIWAKPDKRGRFFDNTHDAATYAIRQCRGGKDVYFGCGLYRPGITKGRGKADDVVCTTALWADVDCGKEGAFPTRKGARKWLRSLAFPPSMIVRSGKGYHAYWMLREPLPLSDESSRTLPRRWIAHLQALASEVEVKLDQVGDRARVLRVPGTDNYKGEEPSLVATVKIGKRRYGLSDLEAQIARTAKRKDNHPLSTKPAASWPSVDFEKLRDLVSRLSDQRARDYEEWLKVGQCIHSAFPGENGLALWIEFSRRTTRDNFDEAVCREKWTSFSRHGGTTIATLLQMAYEDTNAALFTDKKFKPAALAEFIERRFTPICYVDRTFYVYASAGVWRATSDDAVGAYAAELLGPLARSTWIKDALQLLKYRAQRRVEEFQPNPDFINLRNGMLEIVTRELHPHDPKYNSRSQLPFDYDPHATAPRFGRFLREIFAGEPEEATTLQQWFGYCLTVLVFLQLFLLLVGRGANGKSVVLHVLRALVGPRNSCAIALDRMERDFVLVELRDKLVNLSGEIDTSRPLKASIMKVLTGEDVITVDKKYCDPVTFQPVAKHVFAVNELPRFKDRTPAMHRRALILGFEQRFEREARDPHLAKKLEKELPGILIWALDGLDSLLQEREIYRSKSSLAYQKRFAEVLNPVLAFVRKRCVLDSSARIRRTWLYAEYEEWHHTYINRFPLARSSFYETLFSDFPQLKSRRIHGYDYVSGIRLKRRAKRKTLKKGKRGKVS